MVSDEMAFKGGKMKRTCHHNNKHNEAIVIY